MITVAVASFNHAPFVEECLESIVAQTYEEIELSWVDDHSQDGTFDVVCSLLTEPRVYNRFRNVNVRRNRKNRGAAFSLNLAARAGTGNLISFVNSDDYYHPNRLARCTEETSRVGQMFFSFSNALPVDTAGCPLVSDPVGQGIAFDADLLTRRFGSPTRALLKKQIASSTGNFIVSRALFDQIGGFVDLKYCHDWMFALQACLYCEPVLITDRLYYYRLHPSNSFRSLSAVAERETEAVLAAFFEAVALRSPVNEGCPCPRRNPASFWEIAQATGAIEAAERVFFPYLRASRLLSPA